MFFGLIMIKHELIGHSCETAVQTLLKDTNKLAQPICYNNFFDSTFLQENDIKNALNIAIKQKAKEYFRVWIDKNERNDMPIKIIHTPINEDESLELWTKRIFDNQKFCIFFNRAEQFNDSLTTNIANILKPLYESCGMAMGGTSMVFFIGNYGYTPSGMHQDPEDNTIFHFHLGPGTKKMFTMEPSKFNSITNSKDTLYDFEKILKHADCFILKSNSFLSMPAEYYHIGYTEDFSIGVGVVLTDATNIQITQDIFKNFGYEGISRVKKVYKLDSVKLDMSLDLFTSNAFNQLSLNQKNKAKTFEEIVKSQIEDRHLRMLSNLAWSFPPLFKESSNYELNGLKIQLKIPYKIYYKRVDLETMSIFMRGRELVAKYNEILEHLIDKINLGNKLLISELIQPYSEVVNKKLALSFISQSIEHSAVNLMV